MKPDLTNKKENLEEEYQRPPSKRRNRKIFQ